MKRQLIKWLAAWFLIVGCLAGCARQDSSFMSVGNYEVEKEEYALFAYDNLASAALLYGQKYQADVNEPGFWDTEYDGRTPMEYVQELTDAEVLEQKGIQICAKEEGLIEDINYEGFLEQYEKEKVARKENSENGEVIYGPVYLSKEQYYSYRQSQIEQILEEYLEQEKITITEEEAKNYYPIVNVQEGKKNFQADLQITAWNKSTGEQVALQKVRIDTMELGKENFVFDRVVDAVKDLDLGEVSDIVDLGSDLEGTILVKGKEYVPFGSYEETSDYVKLLLREEKTKEYLEKKLDGFEIVRGETYHKFSYEDVVDSQSGPMSES